MELTEVEKLLIAIYQKMEPSADRIGAMHKRELPVTSNGSSARESGAQERGRLPADTVSTGRQWCQQKMFFENRDHFCPDLSSTVK